MIASTPSILAIVCFFSCLSGSGMDSLGRELLIHAGNVAKAQIPRPPGLPKTGADFSISDNPAKRLETLNEIIEMRNRRQTFPLDEEERELVEQLCNLHKVVQVIPLAKGLERADESGLSESDGIGLGAKGGKKILKLITFTIKKTPKYFHNLGAVLDVTSDLKDLYKILNLFLENRTAWDVVQGELDSHRTVGDAKLALEKTRAAMLASKKFRKNAALIDFASSSCAVREGIADLIKEHGMSGCVASREFELLSKPTVHGAKDERYQNLVTVRYSGAPVRKYCTDHSSIDSQEQIAACTLAVRRACMERVRWYYQNDPEHTVASFEDEDQETETKNYEKANLITGYYQEVLGRGPSAGEIRHWADHMEIKPPSLGEVTRHHIIKRGHFERQFVDASKAELEARKEEIVQSMYRKVLSRDGRPDEIATWAGTMTQYLGVRQFEQAFRVAAEAELKSRR